jgi:hypothetical protein
MILQEELKRLFELKCQISQAIKEHDRQRDEIRQWCFKTRALNPGDSPFLLDIRTSPD